MEGITNLRSLGGYRNKNQQVIKDGLIYRSGQLDQLTPAQTQYLATTLGITRIVDMRSADERHQFPDATWSHVQYHVLDVLAQVMTNDASLQSMISSTGAVHDRMVQLYEQLALDPTARQSYCQFIQLLLVPDQPLLFHCFAGKDRTGVGAALFLKILGISDEQIMADYLLTNQARAAANQQILATMASQLSDEQQRAVNQALLVDADYLSHYFEVIKARYDTFSNYLQTGLGLTSAECQQLRELYLTK
ncbi:tyrosine-protein phosphatase [Lactiplantibacillus plantarum]|nr:tyrosine-protein phosphatase [Lactiplantibacillus plantarum]